LEKRNNILQLKPNESSYISEQLVPIKILQDNSLEQLISDFLTDYTSIEVPKLYNRLLDELILKYNLTEQKSEFIAIVGFLKYAINLHNIDDTRKELEKGLFFDYQNEKCEWIKLLDFIKDYLHQSTRPDIDRITFKTDGKNLILKNFFVVKDFIDGVCSGYNITIDNYDVRRNEILNDLNSIKLDKVSDFVIRKGAELLVDFFMSKDLRMNESLRFTGFLFRLSGVRTYKNEEVVVYKTLKDNLSDVNIKNLRLQIKRIPPFYV
jgi:hypothetical protein